MHLNENTILQLFCEQHIVKQEFDQHIRLDFLGIDDVREGKQERYEYLKILASRIMQIEAVITEWLDQIDVGELASEI